MSDHENDKKDPSFVSTLGKTVALNTAASAGVMGGLFLGLAGAGAIINFINSKKSTPSDTPEE